MTRKLRYRESRAKKIYLLRRIWGPLIPTFPGSPYEGDNVDEAEIVLHELAHHTLLPEQFAFKLGNMFDSHEIVSVYIDGLPRWRRDVHEIKAIAIELVAARLLGLRLNGGRLIKHSRRNTELYKFARIASPAAYERIVRRTMKTESVLTHAETILALIDQVRRSES